MSVCLGQEVDIRVLDHLKEKFSEMCPIFKNTEVSHADFGDFMQTYAPHPLHKL